LGKKNLLVVVVSYHYCLDDHVEFLAMITWIAALIASIEVVPLLVTRAAGLKNTGSTKWGKFLRETDVKYHRSDICWLAFTLCTVICAVRIVACPIASLPIRVVLAALVLSLNYCLVFPVFNIFNMILRPFCKNKSMNLDKSFYFPYSKVLEGNFAIIKTEITQFMDDRNVPCFDEFRPDTLIDTRKDGNRCWRFVSLKKMGKFDEAYRSVLPNLYKLVDRPEIASAVISSLDPGTEIPPHRGYNRAYIRYHLALEAPTDNPAYIVCGGVKYVWKVGEGVCFDDLFTHYVKNPSTQRRTVLFLDIKRSGLPSHVNSMVKVANHLIENSKLLEKMIADQHVPKKI
jgi:aspartyl/asparaginyl beta-hydroxylase (cupin superfamily)